MVVGITGGSGFIGRHLVKKLILKNFQVKVLALTNNPNFPKEVKFVKGDLVKKKNLAKFLKEIDVLIHLAGSVLPPDNTMMENNVMSTFNLISEAINYPIKQIIFTSSVAVYGKSGKAKFKEIDECFPNTTYGLSKYLAEKIVLYWGNLTGKPVTIFRPFNVYGPGNYKGIIYSFFSNIKNKGTVIIYGDGKQERDFLYVEDLVEAIFKVVGTKESGIFNLGNPNKYSILEIFKLFKKIMKKDINLKFGVKEEGKVFNINQDLSKAKKVLGWQAETSIEEGLQKTIDWYEKN